MKRRYNAQPSLSGYFVSVGDYRGEFDDWKDAKSAFLRECRKAADQGEDPYIHLAFLGGRVIDPYPILRKHGFRIPLDEPAGVEVDEQGREIEFD